MFQWFSPWERQKQRSGAARMTISDLNVKTINNCNALYTRSMVFLMWQCDYSAAGVQQFHFNEHISGAKYFRDRQYCLSFSPWEEEWLWGMMDKRRAASWDEQRVDTSGWGRDGEFREVSICMQRTFLLLHVVERAYASRVRVPISLFLRHRWQ